MPLRAQHAEEIRLRAHSGSKLTDDLPNHCHATNIPPTLFRSAVYAGSKAFVDAFSRSLDAEYAPLGVRVQNQSPMFVATKMSKIRCGRGL